MAGGNTRQLAAAYGSEEPYSSYVQQEQKCITRILQPGLSPESDLTVPGREGSQLVRWCHACVVQHISLTADRPSKLMKRYQQLLYAPEALWVTGAGLSNIGQIYSSGLCNFFKSKKRAISDADCRAVFDSAEVGGNKRRYLRRFDAQALSLRLRQGWKWDALFEGILLLANRAFI